MRKKHNGKFLTTPTRKAVKGMQASLRRTLNALCGEDTWTVIRRLNLIIRGWCNYHRHACSSRIFKVIDSWLFREIKRWLHRRHPNKGRRWIMKRYYRNHDGIRWSFHAVRPGENGRKEYVDLLIAGRTRIVRHVKIQAAANPYDPGWYVYFAERRKRRQVQFRNSRFVEEFG
ncbi:MAG: hypothetical protein JW925_07355 [Syntrophaceae bacterium]|nr:hypothetical protein [Syntrophaceae bacterium]